MILYKFVHQKHHEYLPASTYVVDRKGPSLGWRKTGNESDAYKEALHASDIWDFYGIGTHIQNLQKSQL